MSNFLAHIKLKMLQRFHTHPINVVVYDGSIVRNSFEVNFSSALN
jgi:hypothetical protein